MTLRVLVTIRPFGDFTKEYTIHELQISNITREEGGIGYSGPDLYLVRLDDFDKPHDEYPIIQHERSKGALELLRVALERINMELEET